ncbi:MAG: hypothetical protein KAU50_04660, partial [Candidatus Marinimicrobia bacterium]|nr:hypothetical protein [Candidatus Neomarinimicrobiota bacterium]
KKTRFNFLITPFYAVTIIAFILNAITFITASSHLSVELWQTFQRTYNLTWVLFSAGALLGLINIIHSYLTAASEPDRRKLRWVMMGMAVTIVGYTCLWPIPIVLIGHPLLALDYILLIDAVMPITFGISIIRYRFLNIDLIFNRSAVYTIVLGAMLLIYAIVLGILTTLDDSLAGRTSFFSTGIAAAAVAFMFEPTRRRVQQFVDRTLFRTRYNYKEAVDQLSKKISNAISQEHVGSELVNRLSKLLDVSCIGVYGRDQTGQRFTLLANVNCQGLMAEQLTQIDRQIPDLQLPLSSEGALEPGTPYETASGGLLKNLQLCLVMPIVADLSSRHGGLLLGPKRNGICFTQEDVDLLKAAALQAGSAMAKITLREKLVEEREATRRLAEMNELKSFFVSSVSHELKTPLTSIRMFAELLRDQQNLDESKKHEYLDIIEGESGRLSRLINNVLDLAKVERGVQEYNFETLDVNQTINTVLNSLGYQLKMHKFTVTRQLGDMELLIKADSDALIEILENLITNAMKYSGKSKEITISSSRRHDQVILSVQDRGLGIPEGDLQNIFDPFYRAKDKEHRSREGTGLGLALTKHILEAHQGEIEIDSTPGEGSTFTIKFPAEE